MIGRIKAPFQHRLSWHIRRALEGGSSDVYGGSRGLNATLAGRETGLLNITLKPQGKGKGKHFERHPGRP